MSADPQSPEYARFSALKIKPFQSLRRKLQYGLVRFFLAFASRLPIRGSQLLGRWTGRLAYPFALRDRAICDYQLELVYPEMSARERHKITRQVFECLGMTLWEMLALPRIREEAGKWLQLEGADELQEAHAAGKGVILFTGHMANWELNAVACQMLDLPTQAVVRGIVNKSLNDLILKHRESDRIRIVQRGARDAARQLLNCFKAGDVLLLALDHDVDVPGVFVDFFGMSANTPRVAASLALRLGVPVFSGFDIRLPDGTHKIVYRRIAPPQGIANDQQGVREYTQIFSDAMEAHIREYPGQWTWNHRRWKRRPNALEAQTQ